VVCRLFLVVLVVGCGSDGAGVDARLDAYEPYAGPVDYVVRGTATQLDPPRPDVTPTVAIDGVATEWATLTYPDQAAAIASSHTIELRVDTDVVRRFTWQTHFEGCEAPLGLRQYELELCWFASGDIRLGSVFVDGDTADGHTAFCTADAFCTSPCYAASCAAGERCTSRATLLDPFFSHLGCAPTGPRDLGEACTWIADPDGAYDDCGADLVCIAGTCRRTCMDPSCQSGCAPALGHAPELRVCP
jgi:hypothetical protein